MTKYTGLKFKKCDLHIHTPASDDYSENTITAEQVVEKAINEGLHCIAITDHQSVDFIDSVKSAAKNKDLIVFPGVELLVNGGEKGVHLILLFDVDKDAKHIDQFLNLIGIFERDGKKDKAAEKTAGQIADDLQKYDPSALMILAHCHSSKGVTGDIKGETRKMIFEKRRRSLLGAEANNSDFIDEKKIKEKKRVIDCFNGEDQNYNYTKLGVYQSSDAHSLSEIGQQYTYFKLDDKAMIEDLRQALIDRETRIRQPYEIEDVIYPKIISVKATSGFLQDQEVVFHEGLNSILGAKGSGKSLVLEFLRFALKQQPTIKEIRDDHTSKLEKCLKTHGEVEVVFMDEAGKEYLVRRKYNSAQGNPIEIIDKEDGTVRDFDIEQVFPVLFLSQNEIIRIAEDKTGTNQREFIDNFFDFHRYQNEITRLNKELSEVDLRFSEVLKARLSSVALAKRIKTCKEEIDKLSKQIKNDIFDRYSKKEKIGQQVNGQKDFITELKNSFKEIEQEYKDLDVPSGEESEEDASVARAKDIAKEAIEGLKNNIGGLIRDLEEKEARVLTEYQSWEKSFAEIKANYSEVVKSMGGTQVALDQKRKVYINDLSRLEKELARHSGKARQANIVAKKRKNIIEELERTYKAYFDERKNRCEFFTNNSGGALEVTIIEREDKTSFKQNLLKFKKGSWLKDDEVERITECISPKDFIAAIMKYEWSNKENKDSIKELHVKTGISQENVEKLVKHLLEEYDYKDIFGILYTSVPKDVPKIAYKVGDSFRPLEELSVGQKAVTLLIIALSDGTLPVVVDQPEDSLDLRSIWEDVCCKLRGNKEKRQFVFTTHNSSVAVASDTDKFTILQADSNMGKVLCTGSINSEELRTEVIDYLEGGHTTYLKKRKKYNINE